LSGFAGPGRLIHAPGHFAISTLLIASHDCIVIAVHCQVINGQTNFVRYNAAMLDIEKLRKLREKAGLSQEDAAKRAGLNSRQAWYNIESGLQANVTMTTLDSLAKALGVKARDLVK
jgi:DNA-binding XRE family transcriptional regulator